MFSLLLCEGVEDPCFVEAQRRSNTSPAPCPMARPMSSMFRQTGMALFLYSHGYVAPGSPNPAEDVGDPLIGGFMLAQPPR
jgi:hypothetical protein